MSVRFVPDRSGVGRVEMRDERGRNAMSLAFVEALSAALREAAAWREGKVVVLTGLPDVFSSGADEETLAGLVRGELLPSDILLPRLVLDLPIPVVAAMAGHAIGGGLALGLCADVVLAARESRYGASFVSMGITPGMGTTRLLQWALSPAIAAELLFTGEARRGRDFEGRSGFNAILPRAEVEARALDVAARIAEKPRVTLELLKRTLSLPRRQAFEETITIESLMHRVTFAAPDVLGRIREHHAE